MKKIIPYISLSLKICCVVLLGACGRLSAKSGSLEFFYEKNSAQKVSVEGSNYVKMLLEIKNNGEGDAEIEAQKFSLVAGGETVSGEVFFGNNVVDKMDKESISMAESESLVLNLELIGDATEFDLYYDETVLVRVTI